MKKFIIIIVAVISFMSLNESKGKLFIHRAIKKHFLTENVSPWGFNLDLIMNCY